MIEMNDEKSLSALSDFWARLCKKCALLNTKQRKWLKAGAMIVKVRGGIISEIQQNYENAIDLLTSEVESLKDTPNESWLVELRDSLSFWVSKCLISLLANLFLL